MLQIILYIIPVFIVYLFIRACWVSNETLKTRYKIARLKDELTWLAISEQIDKENKEYAHLYDSMDKGLKALRLFNFWVMLYLLVSEKYKINVTEIAKVRHEIEKNSTFKDIYDAYYTLLITYIARKNFITVLLTFPVWKKILDTRLSVNENDHNMKSTYKCINSDEYSSFAFYIQNISAKSLLVG